MGLRHRPLILALALGWAVCACGSSVGGASPSSAQGTAATQSTGGTGTAAKSGSGSAQKDVPRPYASPLVQYTTSDGWTYQWKQPPLPLATMTVKKEVQFSPPGKARLTTDPSFAGQVLPQDFAVPTAATPGRTAPRAAGPTVNVVFPVTQSFFDFATATKNRISTACDIKGFSGGWYGGRSATMVTSGATVPGWTFSCNTLAIGQQLFLGISGQAVTTADLDEAFVDQYASFLKPEIPGILVFYVGSCSVALHPTGEVAISYLQSGQAKCEIVS